mmetsp:Transcript_16236/g.53051  ORF Transcript_16236/g.53051 Transcript_16236/m.53051 type:complete len:240 (-) Transcript_16236:1538-2257(-)
MCVVSRRLRAGSAAHGCRCTSPPPQSGPALARARLPLRWPRAPPQRSARASSSPRQQCRPFFARPARREQERRLACRAPSLPARAAATATRTRGRSADRRLLPPAPPPPFGSSAHTRGALAGASPSLRALAPAGRAPAAASASSAGLASVSRRTGAQGRGHTCPEEPRADAFGAAASKLRRHRRRWRLSKGREKRGTLRPGPTAAVRARRAKGATIALQSRARARARAVLPPPHLRLPV